MTKASASQSGESVPPLTPTSRNGQRALIEQLAHTYAGSPQSPRRTASDAPRGTAVPLLYTKIYNENGFRQEIPPLQTASRSDAHAHTDDSSQKHRAVSSPDLEPLQEIDSSLSLSSVSSDIELPNPVEMPSNASPSVMSRKERNGLQLPAPRNTPSFGVPNLKGEDIVENHSHNGGADIAGQASGARNEPFDPQRAYPSDACIFVANLLESAPDEKLAEALTVVFGRYGTVFIKIKRKSTNMPYAFVQFTNAEDARAAMQGARGALILDRVCRVEPANSKRFWLVRRADSKRTSVVEVRQAMAGQGACNIQEAQASILEALGIDHGVRVEFPQWEQSRDLRRSIGSQFIAEPLDEFALTRRQQNITASKSRVNRRNNGDESGSNGEKFGVEGNPSTETPSRWSSFMERYDRDRRSVFCGNLPSDTTEIELRRVLERTGGHVKGVKIIRGAHSAYAFIEFGRADVYEAAIGILNGSDLRGMSMKIERKRARVPSSAPSPIYQQRFASSPQRGNVFLPPREPQEFTPQPHRPQRHNEVENDVQHLQNESVSLPPNKVANGSSAPMIEPGAQCQPGDNLPLDVVHYIDYMRYLLSSQQHAQALRALQDLHIGRSVDGPQKHDSIQGLQDAGVQMGSQPPEHFSSAVESGTGLGGGTAGMPSPAFNPFALPCPLLSPSSGVFPGGVPFLGMPYSGPPLSPAYPVLPGHLSGGGNQPGSGPPAAITPANGPNHTLNSAQNTGPTMVPGRGLDVNSILNPVANLTVSASVNGGNRLNARPSHGVQGPHNGGVSLLFPQASVPGQNGTHHRVGISRAPDQILDLERDPGTH